MQQDTADEKTNKFEVSYTLEDTVLENVESIKYLDVAITHDFKWNMHISVMFALTKLGFL